MHAETCLQGLVGLPILPGCPHEQRDDNDERQKDQENENDCRRNVHATTVSQNAAALTLDQPLRSSVLGGSAAVAFEGLPKLSVGPPSQKVSPLERAAPATESLHSTPSNSQGDSDCSCRRLLELRQRGTPLRVITRDDRVTSLRGG